MINKITLGLFSILLFSPILLSTADAHSMFNSAEKFEAGYRVQVATLPEFPQVDEPSQLRVRVTEGFEYREVDNFTMGIRIFFHDRQIDAIPPTAIKGSHWDIDYVWRTPGSHIVIVDLYDVREDNKVISYKFNMETQNPFGYIFFAAIIFGALSLLTIIIYIYAPKHLKDLKLRFNKKT